MTTHITGEATCERDRRVPPAGWTSALWTSYLGDPDGALAPCRREHSATFAYPPDTTPSFVEIASRDEA